MRGVPTPIPEGRLDLRVENIEALLLLLGGDDAVAGFRSVLTTTPIRVASPNRNRVALNVRNYSSSSSAILWLIFTNSRNTDTVGAYPLRQYEGYEWNLTNLYRGEVWAVATGATGELRFMEVLKTNVGEPYRRTYT